ncbi:MAG: glycosyltransferase [Gallionella sp.]|nr:glycosyltransferase [Gallionella sp.]MDD4960284.1 glycosyltransferase [Gallionella sp.]
MALDNSIEVNIIEQSRQNAPLVSINMITFNHESYLADAIEGVLHQKTNFPFELVIGEDCSTDSTRAIALQYQQKYPDIIRVICPSSNVGFIKNLQLCFQNSHGEYIAYCEGDDFWHDPLKLQKQVDFLRENRDYGMVHSDCNWLVQTCGLWRTVKSRNSLKHGTIPQGEVYPDLLKSMFITTCTLMVRTNLLAQFYTSSLYTPRYPVGDRPIVLFLSKLAKVGYLDESLATYRRTPGSYCNTDYRSLLRKQNQKIEMDRDIASILGANEMAVSNMEQDNHQMLLFFCLVSANKDEFERTLQWLQKHHPSFAQSHKVKFWTKLIGSPLALSGYVYMRTMARELDLLFRSFV